MACRTKILYRIDGREPCTRIQNVRVSSFKRSSRSSAGTQHHSRIGPPHPASFLVRLLRRMPISHIRHQLFCLPPLISPERRRDARDKRDMKVEAKLRREHTWRIKPESPTGQADGTTLPCRSVKSSNDLGECLKDSYCPLFLYWTSLPCFEPSSYKRMPPSI